MATFLAVILVALSLGLSWALRGHFGHEWGACWAGSIGALAVLAAARRNDWSRRMPVLAALGGIGWAAGGMMSYGRIVGFGRSGDFANVCYGLVMLAVVGGLYGFLGGGLLGLGLETTPGRKPSWSSLLAEMVAGAMLCWGLLIYQFEWYMTPPRSELWAACLGAALALAWFLARNDFYRALRVAAYSALGAGFGFAAGNFLQTLGTLTSLPGNWWNLMEFTLGFCGGLGMAWGVLSRPWPVCVEPSRTANWLGLLFLAFAVPAVNLLNAFETADFVRLADRLDISDPLAFAHAQILSGWLAAATTLLLAVLSWRRFREHELVLSHVYVPLWLFGYSTLYIVFSHLKKGFFHAPLAGQLEQWLYWIVLGISVATWLFGRRAQPDSIFISGRKETMLRWVVIVAGLVALVGAMSWISVHCHDGLPGAHNRF